MKKLISGLLAAVMIMGSAAVLPEGSIANDMVIVSSAANSTKKPKKTAVKSVKSTKANKLTVKYKKVSNASGYQIKYSTTKKFTKATSNTVTVKGKSKTTKTISGLKGGKTYYVKVRAYRTVKGKKYYSAYSKAKKASVKKTKTNKQDINYDYKMDLIYLFANYCNNAQLIDKTVDLTGYAVTPITTTYSNITGSYNEDYKYFFKMYINPDGEIAYVSRENYYGFNNIKYDKAKLYIQVRCMIKDNKLVEKIKNMKVGTYINLKGKIYDFSAVKKDEYKYSGYDAYYGNIYIEVYDIESL